MFIHMIVYVSNAGTRDISVLELNQRDGTARLIENVPAAGEVMHLAIGPPQKYLYASLTSEPHSVSSWDIDSSTGKLRDRYKLYPQSTRWRISSSTEQALPIGGVIFGR